MPQPKYLTIFFVLFLGHGGHCCINEYRALLNGDLVFVDKSNAAPRARFNSDNHPFLLEKLHEADSIYKLTGKLEDYSDLGSMLVYTGKYFEAKKIFQSIERSSPGRYQTAANLGTTYELLGKNDSAFYWIKKAIEINPASHGGSEWIHLKILEAKIKANGDDEYLWMNSILSLDFGETEVPENKDNVDLESLRDHLYEQLNERMSFIEPEDPIVAQLLFDLGNVCAITMDVTSGLQVYQSARQYGYSSDLFDKRQSYFARLQTKADLRNNTEGWAKANPMLALAIIGISFIALISGFIFLFRRRKIPK